MTGTRIPLLDPGCGDGCTASEDTSNYALDLPEFTGEGYGSTNTLGLNVTMQCPLRCDFCCYACHPKRTERMPLELALDLVEQASELGVFSGAGFTGGEPFLWLDELLATGDLLRQKGLPFNVVTAGHWAADPVETQEIVDALVERGLIRLNLSTDPSHARFVPRESVVNAAQAAATRGVAVHVTGAFSDQGATLEEFVPELVDVPHVVLKTRPIAPAGRARKQRTAQEHKLDFAPEQLRCYRPVYHDLIFFWDGDAYPCCSVYNRDTDGIKLGNAYQDSLQTIWERAEGSLLLRTMKRAGFQHLYAVLEELDPGLARRLPALDPGKGPCRLCNEVFSDVELTRDIKDTFVAYERQTVEALLASLEAEFGTGEAVNIVRSAIASDGRTRP